MPYGGAARIECAQRRPDRRAHRIGVAERPDGDVHLRVDARLEHVWDRRLVETLAPHVGDDPDDRLPRPFGAGIESVLQSPAHRLLAGPVAPRHLLVDHDDLRRLGGEVAVLEQAATPQRDAHRLEVPRHDLVLGQRRGGIVGAPRRLALERHAIVGLPMDEEIADRASGGDAGQRPDPAHRLAVELGRLLAGVVGPRQVDLQQEHVLRIEPALGPLDAGEAADEEPRAGQEHDRQRDFGHGQNPDGCAARRGRRAPADRPRAARPRAAPRTAAAPASGRQ